MAPGVVLVGLRPGVTVGSDRLGVQASDPSLSAALATVGVEGVEPLWADARQLPDGAGLGSVYRLRLAPEADIPSTVQALSANPAVAYAVIGQFT